jgi:hypothetical protein
MAKNLRNGTNIIAKHDTIFQGEEILEFFMAPTVYTHPSVLAQKILLIWSLKVQLASLTGSNRRRYHSGPPEPAGVVHRKNWLLKMLDHISCCCYLGLHLHQFTHCHSAKGVDDREILEIYLNSASKNTPETDIFPHGTESLLTSAISNICGLNIFIIIFIS